MLTVVAHAGRPPAPHDLWGAWNTDPVLLAGLVLVAWLYARGRMRGPGRRADRRRTWCIVGALAALGVALVSPLDALSGALASAHMVQHVLLVLVAAPLLATGAPSGALVRGTPAVVRRVLLHGSAGSRGARHRTARAVRSLQHPVAVWLCHVATLWIWHAAAPYDAALRHPLVHVGEHATFLVTGVLFWRIVVGPRSPNRVPPGAGVLLVFTMALQSVFLSVLLTFARASWYTGYAATTGAWGLTPLADQQLAGAIMWVPAGLIYVGAALGLLALWIRESEVSARPTSASRQP